MSASQRTQQDSQTTSPLALRRGRRPEELLLGGTRPLTSPLLKQASADPRSLPPSAIPQLQRSLGNRAVTRALAQPHQSAPAGPVRQRAPALVQRKRNFDEIEEEERKDYMDGRKEKKLTPSENYDKSLLSGNNLKAKGLKWFTKHSSAEKPVTSTETDDKVTQAGYKDFWFFNSKGTKVTISTHRGPEVADLKSQEVEGYDISDDFEDDQDYFYSNSFDTLTGQFSASINYREWDQEEADKNKLSAALPNSEIIWHQHRLAQRVANEKAKKENRNDFKASRLNAISREQISNEQTLDTIFMSDGGGQARQGGEVTIEDGTDPDVWALLGTPNGNSSVWVLMQHGHEQKMADIESVTYTKDGLVIKFMHHGD